MPSEKSHRLLIYDRDPKLYEEAVRKRLPHLDIHSTGQPEEALPYIGEAEIILAWKMPDDLLKRAKRLRWYASMGAGNEHLVKNPSLPASVTLTKTTVYGEMMAEYVFAYLLYSIRNGSKHLEDQKKKVWDPIRPERLRGKVLGVLGLGSVGREIARRGKQFGMRVIGIRRSPGLLEEVDQVFGPGEVRQVIQSADVLVLALPHTPETHRFLGEGELASLKDGAILFNIGRGKTIDEEALIRTLKKRKVRAVLDVFEAEPLPPESELWTLENAIVTPHVSGINLPDEICEGFAVNYERWVKGESLIGLIDRERGY